MKGLCFAEKRCSKRRNRLLLGVVALVAFLAGCTAYDGRLQDPTSVQYQTSVRYPPAEPVTPRVAIAAETPPQDEIQLQLHKGVFAVPVVINRAINIPFVLDSGAADVQLP